MHKSILNDKFIQRLASTSAGALMTIALAICMASFFIRTTTAAPITNAIIDVSVSPETDVNPYNPITVTISWCVPDDVNPGDTFTLGLPSQMQPATSGFPLLDEDELTVANATILGNEITFTLTNYVLTHDAVCGEAHFEQTLNINDFPGNTSVPVVYTSDPTDFPITLTTGSVSVDDRSMPYKSRWWANVSDQGRSNPEGALNWNIESPIAPTEGWNSVRFTDTAQAGYSFDCSSLYVVMQETDVNGVLLPASTVSYADPLTITSCSGSGFDIAITNVPAGYVAILVVPSTITDQSLTTFTNVASVSVDGGSLVATNSISAVRSSAGGSGSGTGTTTGNQSGGVTTNEQPVVPGAPDTGFGSIFAGHSNLLVFGAAGVLLIGSSLALFKYAHVVGRKR